MNSFLEIQIILHLQQHKQFFEVVKKNGQKATLTVQF